MATFIVGKIIAHRCLWPCEVAERPPQRNLRSGCIIHRDRQNSRVWTAASDNCRYLQGNAWSSRCSALIMHTLMSMYVLYLHVAYPFSDKEYFHRAGICPIPAVYPILKWNYRTLCYQKPLYPDAITYSLMT